MHFNGLDYIENMTERAATIQIKKLSATEAREHRVVIWRCECGNEVVAGNEIIWVLCKCGKYMKFFYED